MRGEYGGPWKVGHRVEISPHFDLWMRGARFGTVVDVDAERGEVVVKLDLHKKRQRFKADDLKPAF